MGRYACVARVFVCVCVVVSVCYEVPKLCRRKMSPSLGLMADAAPLIGGLTNGRFARGPVGDVARSIKSQRTSSCVSAAVAPEAAAALLRVLRCVSGVVARRAGVGVV